MTKIPVFFSPRLVAPQQRASPSAHKPATVVADWLDRGFPMEVLEPQPVNRNQLALAHAGEFVDDVMELRRDNGFGNRSAAVAASLPHTSGAMLAAARASIANRRVAVAPVSGFHHAGYEEAGGFCTFNGLMVAACTLRAEGLVTRVGVLDFDQHYGNGTDDIIAALGADWVEHLTAGATWRHRSQAVAFLDAIPEMVAKMSNCDVILYQAGADPHIADPYGGWLTTDELHQRDVRVFTAAKEEGVPIAWNLAGGYQRTADGGIEPVLEIHRNTMFACLQVYGGALNEVAQTDDGLSRPSMEQLNRNNNSRWILDRKRQPMSRKVEKAIEALGGTYVKTEELKRKQANLLKILKSAAESGQPIESIADSEAAKLEPSTGIGSKTPNSRIV